MPSIEKHKEFRLNRLFSTPLSGLLLKTPITPNQVTVTSLLFGVLAGFLFSQGTYVSGLWAALCYQTAIVLDNCDGEIARAKNLKSAFGAWLDIIADFFTDTSLFIGIGFGVLKNSPEKPAGLFIALCLFGAAAHLSLVILEKLKGFGPAVFHAPNPDGEKRQNIFFNLFDSLREGESSWFVVTFAILGTVEWLLWFGGIYMQILWISVILLNFKWIFGKARRS